MDERDIRLLIIRAVVPQATRVGMNNPQDIVKTCEVLEKYVLDSGEGDKKPVSPPKRKPGRPRKDKPKTPPFME